MEDSKAEEILVNLKGQYDRYHDSKERMAWLATALYASFSIVFIKWLYGDGLSSWNPWILIGLSLTITACASCFIRFQYARKRECMKHPREFCLSGEKKKDLNSTEWPVGIIMLVFFIAQVGTVVDKRGANMSVTIYILIGIIVAIIGTGGIAYVLCGREKRLKNKSNIPKWANEPAKEMVIKLRDFARGEVYNFIRWTAALTTFFIAASFTIFAFRKGFACGYELDKYFFIVMLVSGFTNIIIIWIGIQKTIYSYYNRFGQLLHREKRDKKVRLERFACAWEWTVFITFFVSFIGFIGYLIATVWPYFTKSV